MNVMKHTKQKTALLFNPWIYDFAAYDFWIKPIGLLTLGALLRANGWTVQLIDCLDRYHPLTVGKSKDKSDGTGKFIRQEIEKPAVLKDVPRRFCRYGMPPGLVRSLLEKIEAPDLILVTSVMTYWYPAVRDAVRLMREYFPQAHLMLGGIYATLCPQHAAAMQPDELVTGEGELAVMRR
ncbi:MAG: cobalamin B12-binding domain-containing protein, partial [candidate division KSB1 bacterium]|nr:cobalamin B12-binding domain-containing protein [candidate division KSB1 bacterium]